MEKYIKMIYKYIFKLGEKLRNPSINEIFNFLKKSESWSQLKLEEYQLKKLKELVDFSVLHSDYYKKKFNKIDLEINSLKDLEKIPILTKEKLLKNSKEIQSRFKHKKLYKANTSGTSGNSLTFYRDEYGDSFNRASALRGYSWYNVKPWEKNGYFWGFNFSFSEKLKTIFLDFLQNRFRVFSYNSKEFKNFVDKLKKVKYIHGYSSMIYQTAKLINSNNLEKPLNIKMIKGTSEKIFDNYQDEVIEAFGKRIVSEYGATESGIIAFECPKGNMHINMESVIVEEYENEILVTNLQMKSFPIIRYKLGDYIKLAPKSKKCLCGLKHRILEEVTGRIGSNIYGKNNVYPSLYFYYIFKNLDKDKNLKLNYQVIQNKKGKLIFNIEDKISEIENKLLKKEIEKYFKSDIEFTINSQVKNVMEGKKKRSFISKIINE